MAGGRLVIMLVGSRDRGGLVTPISNGHLLALFESPFHVQLGKWGFVRCLALDRAVEVNPGLSNRDVVPGGAIYIPTAPSGCV
jgi:hypothetical protein